MMKRATGFLAGLWSISIGCGGGDGPLELEPPAQGVQYTFHSRVEPGVDTERCKFVQVGPEGLNIVRDEVIYNQGSHHVLLWTTSYQEIPAADLAGRPIIPDDEGVFSCAEGVLGNYAALGIIGGAQNEHQSNLDLPEGIAMKVAPNTILLFDVHYLNASDQTLDSTVSLNLHTIPNEEVVTEAQFMLLYNSFIAAPPGERSTARMVCPFQADITLHTFSSHMHARGVDFVASLVDAEGNVLEQLLREDDWASPEVTFFDDTPGGKPIPAGTFLDWTCTYQNDGAEMVYQGGSTRDEMCVPFGVYYPKHDPTQFCSQNGLADFMSLGRSIGSGTATCGESLRCLADAFATHPELPVLGNTALFPCFVNSCEAASRPLYDAFICPSAARATTCAGDCAASESACGACVETTCGPVNSACAASSC